jgi:DNA-directed RNA polymerase subunit RPC12/RpoP
MPELYVCAKCKKEIKRGESSISAVKNLKRLYYHARCFGADHLETKATAEGLPQTASGRETH